RCTTSNVHTYRLLIVKELYSVLLICHSRAIDKALCLSAAKKEEYEAFHYIRQLLLFSRFTLHLHASFSEGANYSPALCAPQGLICSWANIAV
ncbi:hypothetical protein, partial [Janthinobacterium sp. FW305-129]|uniref:hypothetical protein n=1 Tax=Janthinobacterium sp. FW305-129 TaxID=2775054 RepID=UPI001E3FF94A